MANKRLKYNRIFGCEGKIRYESEREAIGAARRARRRESPRGKSRMAIYHYVCKFCSKYHIGHHGTPPKWTEA
jgi:ribosomal protein L32